MLINPKVSVIQTNGLVIPNKNELSGDDKNLSVNIGYKIISIPKLG